MSDIQARLVKIKVLVIDNDGVFTDGGLTYPEEGQPLVKFHIQDGLAIVVAKQAGFEVAILSGRNSAALSRRATELGIKEIIGGVADKAKALQELAERRGWDISEVAFMGDDLNDLPALEIAGFAFAPANAVAEVKQVARWITGESGGNGAVREAIQTILSAQGKWEKAVKAYLQLLQSG